MATVTRRALDAGPIRRVITPLPLERLAVLVEAAGAVALGEGGLENSDDTPSAGLRGAPVPPMSVRTQPGFTALIRVERGGRICSLIPISRGEQHPHTLRRELPNHGEADSPISACHQRRLSRCRHMHTVLILRACVPVCPFVASRRIVFSLSVLYNPCISRH